MTGVDGARLATAGKSHKRQGRPSAETSSLLADWQATMRAELRAIVEALGARKTGLMPDVVELAIPLDDPRRDRLVDRGVKVGRELGTEVDVGGTAAPESAAPARVRRRKPDFK